MLLQSDQIRTHTSTEQSKNRLSWRHIVVPTMNMNIIKIRQLFQSCE